MQFHVLGPLQVVAGGKSIPLGGVKQRATLGFLLLHRNRLVPVSKLLVALWPGPVPATARQILHNAIHRLRIILATAGKPSSVDLLTHNSGYILQVGEDRVDITRFEALARRGRTEMAEGRWLLASETFREALDCWCGPALADLVEEGISWPELKTLQNTRMSLLEKRVDVDLVLGRHDEVIAELELLLETEPLRERVCARLMRALYQSGRQADALSLYRRTRSALIDQTGLEPGPQLRDLERAILNHDRGLLDNILVTP